MVRIMWMIGIALATLIMSAAAQGNKATQVITFGVLPVTRLEVSSNPQSLVVSRDGAGPARVRDASARYSLLSNLDQVRISASINEPLPEGVHLVVRLGAGNGRSAGDVDISDALMPRELVTNIHRGLTGSHSIVYDFSADAGGGAVPIQSRVVTLTVTE